MFNFTLFSAYNESNFSCFGLLFPDVLLLYGLWMHWIYVHIIQQTELSLSCIQMALKKKRPTNFQSGSFSFLFLLIVFSSLNLFYFPFVLQFYRYKLANEMEITKGKRVKSQVLKLFFTSLPLCCLLNKCYYTSIINVGSILYTK